MPSIRLIEVSEDGAAVVPGDDLSDLAVEICFALDGLYKREGFARPWVGYLALTDDNVVVGTCSFKSPPRNNRVEIAYFTFPGFEGKGYGVAMAGELIKIAQATDSKLDLVAQTLPAESASTTILERNKFIYQGMINHPDDGLVWEWVLAAT